MLNHCVMRDSYLEAARVVLRAKGKPLNVREILYEARKYGFLAPHLHGVTMHKTLQARLSEHILEHRFQSIFYRTSPGVFFLRELSNDPNISSKITHEFVATHRKKPPRRCRVLCAPLDLIQPLPSPTKKISLFLDIFRSELASYIMKEVADSNPNLVQVATFCSVFMSGKILIHKAGTYSSTPDYLGRTILGFRNYVSEFDLDFMNDDLIGLRRNASRELLRFIFIKDSFITDIDIMSRMRVAAMVVIGTTVACIILFDASSFPFELRGKRKPLDLNRPQWRDLIGIDRLQLDPLSSAALGILQNDGQVL